MDVISLSGIVYSKSVRVGGDKLDEAISEYKKALEIKPRDDILNKLSQVYRKKRLAGK